MTARDTGQPELTGEDLLLLVRSAAAGITQCLRRELKTCGMTPLEYGCLRLITASSSPLTQCQIRERLQIDRSFAAKMVLRLENRSWVRRVRHVDDARQWFLLPTRAGRAALNRVSRPVTLVYRRIQGPFGRDQWRECLRILRRLSESRAS